MKKGFLSSYFNEVAIKRLSSVEVDPERSNQHEINGVNELRKMFGEAGAEKRKITTNFLHVSNDEGNYESAKDSLTWYDSRFRHPTRTEHRLYYPSNNVTRKFSENDLLIIAKQSNGEVLFLSVEAGSGLENQILWLFDSGKISNSFQIKDISHEDKKLDFTARFILEEMGIQIKDVDEKWLEILINKFGDADLPNTKIFSEFARSTVPQISASEDPDTAILSWMEQEELLFRTFERHLVTRRLESERENIFDGNGRIRNVDNFFQFSLSFQNRRKSRVGQALENHLEEVFLSHNLRYSRGQKTEGNSKPDFIFPSIEYYHQKNSKNEFLTMLGSKSTCKDRWRQVLAEAKKIERKHLFTLQPSISENQTQEMQENSLQLVIPSEIFKTYKPNQQKWLMNLSDFLSLVKKRESSIFGNK
jgi:hypothetical protein